MWREEGFRMNTPPARSVVISLPLFCVVVVFALTSLAISQPGSEPRDRDRPSPMRDPAPGLRFAESDLRLDLIEGDPASDEYRQEVRAVLWAQIVALRAEEERVRRAIRALDQGEAMSTIRSIRGEPRRPHPVEDLKKALGPMLGALANEVEASTFEAGEFTDSQIDEIASFLKEHNPDAAERFAAQRELGTSLFTDLLDRHGQKILRLSHEKRRNPQLFDARIQSAEIERQIRRTAIIAVSANSERADAAQQTLRELISQQFDIRLTVERLETNRLAAAISDRQETVERRELERDRLVDDRLEEILSFARQRAEQHRNRHGDRRGARSPRN